MTSLDPAGRFIYNQVLEIAKLCLEKSKSNQLTCSYFDEMINSLEKLLLEARDKCSQADLAVDHLHKFIKRFLLIVSRVARLLECIEFDPLEFCFLLDFAEQQAKQEAIKIDIPKYIITKLGIDKADPFEEFKNEAEENDVYGMNIYSRTNSITGATSSSGISSSDVADFGIGSETGSATSSNNTAITNNNNNLNVNNSNNGNMKSEIAPCEEDFQEIKLISNGAYG